MNPRAATLLDAVWKPRVPGDAVAWTVRESENRQLRRLITLAHQRTPKRVTR